MTSKGKNLITLNDSGVRTPRGFILDADHYRAAAKPYFPDILDALANDPRHITEIFSTMPIPEFTQDYVECSITKIGRPEHFAVRSSGVVVSNEKTISEDSATTALAGQFESYLAVPLDSVLDAVRATWASLFNPRSISTFAIDEGYVTNSAMTTVIQEMIIAQASGVMMTADPLSDGTTGSMDLTIGACEAIVSGLVSPDEVVFHRAGGRISTFEIGAKECRVAYTPYTAGSENSHIVPNDDSASMAQSVTTRVVEEVIQLGQRIEAIFGVPQDIEFVIDAQNEVVVTQARPVTCLETKPVPFTINA